MSKYKLHMPFSTATFDTVRKYFETLMTIILKYE